ncbi:heme exporter protein D [Sulfitobacter undariae]|uniref:Heme exporter protein D n=1 Tax=Sulfitobacter undariae TaxID=1563671 RepID=A0A7W6E5X6_9RHOB|nr:heme exporter protein D [Sulfitobacter undariae]
MMPDLGKYATEVLSAYGVTFILIGALLAITLIRGAKARAALRRAEEETARHGKD